MKPNLRSTIRVLAFSSVCALVASANATEYLRKFDLALAALNIPPEAAPDYSAFPTAADRISSKEFSTIIDYIDPGKMLRQYMKITNDKVEFYSDRINGATGPNPIEYSLDLAPSGSQDSPELMNRLGKIANAVKAGVEKPLSGFRVLIDPGHMGDGGFWDKASGKFVTANGKTVSEGKLTLWSSMLVANELRALGADVTLTREDFVPVARDYSGYEPSAEIAEAMYKSSRSDWMQKILSKSESELKKEIVSSPEVIKIQDYSVPQYYLKADLTARSEKIDAIKPDLFIDIHFDAATSGLQSRVNNSSVYVPGYADATEYGSKNARARMLKHLLEVRRWKQSVTIAETVVRKMSKNLGIPTLKQPLDEPDAVSVLVGDGVLARNVVPTHRSVHGLTMYFECAHYNHVDEFAQMSKLDATSAYNGKEFQYPSRINAIRDAIRDGILEYFKAFQP